jgi:hypothetical protein
MKFILTAGSTQFAGEREADGNNEEGACELKQIKGMSRCECGWHK